MRLLASLLLCTCAAYGSARAAAASDILLIMIDDLRPLLGCYGDDRIKTPNIDRLARRGVVFERAYCQYAKCGTSRLSLLTGLRPDAVGVFSNNEKDVNAFRSRRPEVQSIVRWLKDHGYHTQSFGKIYHDGWDLPSDWSVPSTPGRPREMWEVIDEQDPAKPTRIAERLDCPVMQNVAVDDDHLFAGRMTREVLKTWNSDRSDQPKFYAVGYRRPHLPFVAPKKYYDMYQVDESWLAHSPLPSQSAPVMAWFNSDGYVGSARKIGLTMPMRPTRAQAIDWNGYELRSYSGVPKHGPIDRALQIELIHAYAACVSYVDAQIGKLLNELDRQQRLDKTHIILCADHGWHLGEHSAWGKMTNYEIATRVPLIIAGPGIQAGHTKSLSELVDLYPTICDLAGIELPKHLQGESLTPTLRAPSKPSQSHAISQYARFQEQFMGYAIRTSRYRYVRWVQTQNGQVIARELYDHQTDRGETTNLSANTELAGLVNQLDSQLDSATDSLP